MTQANADPARGGRHHGLDWLRIAAFGLLILYHVGMVFAPWDWVIKTPHHYQALIAPMAAVTPWRLALLFAVSGYASWHLFAKTGRVSTFVASRNKRLLVPLAFGMVALVPVEMWIRVTDAGYRQSYWHFWTRDYWRWGEFWGRSFPSWEHLWFVVYLWAYTMLLAGVLTLRSARGERRVAARLDWLTHGWRILWAPAAALTLAKMALLFTVEEEQGLLRDWSGHAQYLPMFAAGFLLAGSPKLWPALRRVAGGALAASLVMGAITVVVETHYPGEAIPPHWVMTVERAAQASMAWTMTLALFVLADRYWNRDHRWRRTLAEAVFPFYLIHQPAIVAIAWFSMPLNLPAGAQFALLLSGTGAICVAFYLIGRDIGWLRPLIGLGVRPSARSTMAAPQPA